MILNVEPGWRLPSAATLNFESWYFADVAIVRMLPLDGSIVTIADDGAPKELRSLAIAARALRCRARSIVVRIVKPPLRTVLTP